jgi:hypothetical protein
MQTSEQAEVVTSDTSTKPEELPVLTAADRCDARGCGAQAYFMALIVVDKSELLFCGHHGHEKEEALRAASVLLVDETANILK